MSLVLSSSCTILSSQVVSLSFQSVNFCAAMDTLIDQDAVVLEVVVNEHVHTSQHE